MPSSSGDSSTTCPSQGDGRGRLVRGVVDVSGAGGGEVVGQPVNVADPQCTAADATGDEALPEPVRGILRHRCPVGALLLFDVEADRLAAGQAGEEVDKGFRGRWFPG
ncbi:hypothetical protein [Salinispora arenicola]|uniref:hypothetical protein n=1 Tax=Salinispora arenicola TaxID=168697 RepID=UPI0016ABCAD4|nr:hypothetical protein [Salinispora arenicola]